MKIVSAGTKRTPPPTPTMPPVKPAGHADQRRQELVAAHFEHQLDRDPDQERREEDRDRALGDALLHRGADHDAKDRRDRQQQGGDDVDVAVDPALGDRAEQADQDDRGEAGPGRQPLAVAEPEDQQGDDHRAAADPEEAAEQARQRADRGELENGMGRQRRSEGIVPRY